MIEERAQIVSVRGGRVYVRAFGPGSCEKCAQGQGCGGSVLARLIARKQAEVPVDSRIEDPRPGESVVIGIAESALLRASLLIYGAPLLALLAFGAFAHLLLRAHDVLVALFALCGLGLGLLAARLRGAHAESLPRPLILRRDSSGSRCARLT